MHQPPEIKLIAASAALEAAKDVSAQMHREAAIVSKKLRIVNWAWAAELFPAAARGLVLKQPQNLLHRDGYPQQAIVDAGHPAKLPDHAPEAGGFASTRRARWARYDFPSSFSTIALSRMRSKSAIASGGSSR